VETDVGEGFLKALGNPEGPHALACELVGSMLADWLGLPTLDFSLVEVIEDDEIPFLRGGRAEQGTAFISRSEPAGFPWGGTAKELRFLANPLDINGLVTVDTWLLNCDRHSPDGRRKNLDNVFLVQQEETGKNVILTAIDFTHAFTCGSEISRRLRFIDRIQDDRIYGLFPEFWDYLDRDAVRTLATKLSGFTAAIADQSISAVPAMWEVDRESRAAWAEFITRRAHFLADRLEEMLWPQGRMNLGGNPNE
jgi:hypothetical protein